VLWAACAAQGQVCSECHAEIARSYRATGMGRSFYRRGTLNAENTIENYAKSAYYHAPSDTHFEMIARGGGYFQRQYQIGPDGKQANVAETAIDFVMGSGNHARTYLHRANDGELIELPLGWYAEKGGTWAMNPGYDRPDHAGLNRAVPYGCMFCHNGYPEIPAGAGPRTNPVFLSVPEGIDCQRCHGDGQEHVRLAHMAGTRAEEIRGAIVNPARLPAERGMEVCLQCHLEPKSASSSSLIVRYERGPFSFRPGEPLADFRLHFGEKAGSADRIEIAGASGYRLMQSQCFLQSKGAMTCTTCHDPHREVASQGYAEVCLKCHGAKVTALTGAGSHPAGSDCTGCHMPKRRTQDAVHVVMTDHLIQRKKPAGDLVAALREELPARDGGAVTPWYPAAADDLYLGVAQVNERGTREEGIRRLSTAIAKSHPAAAEYYLQLGDALRANRRFAEAIAPYEEAVRREPESAAADERLAWGLVRVQQFARADAEFKEALRLAPNDASMWKDLGIAYLEQQRMKEAAAAFEKAIALDGNQIEAHNGLGGARMKTADAAGAEAEFRAAIRIRPHYAEAHHNLAHLLADAGRFEEARYHFEESLHVADRAETRADYAAMLKRAGRPVLEAAAASEDAEIRAEARRLLKER